MTIALLATTGAFALGAGWLLIDYLTCKPRRIARYLTLTLLTLVAAIGVAVWQLETITTLGAIGAILVGFIAGYVLRARMVLGREDDRYVPPLTRTADDPGKGHTAVVYFTHGEPETYDPIGWLNQFREFDEQGIAFVPFIARPIFLKRLRDGYLTVGSSQHRQRHFTMARAVKDALHAHGRYDIRVYPSFLDDEPRPDAALVEALNDGASEVVVAEVFVSISNHTAEGEELIHELDTKHLGVPIRFTGPLWDSPTLHQMFVDKVEQARGDTPRDEIGVLLVGHGQPDEWDVEWATETEHELELRHSIMDALVQQGYQQANLDLAWMEFKKPYVPDRAQELAKQGVTKLMVFSTGISAESLHSQYDVPELVAKANLEGTVDIVHLGAWNDHPLAIDAIVEKIEGELGHEAQGQPLADSGNTQSVAPSQLTGKGTPS